MYSLNCYLTGLKDSAARCQGTTQTLLAVENCTEVLCIIVFRLEIQIQLISLAGSKILTSITIVSILQTTSNPFQKS